MREREHQIKFYVNDDELKILNKKIEKSKMKKSEYLRNCSLEKEIIIISSLDEVVYELKKLGININQIAKMLNSLHMVDCKEDLNLAQKELSKVWQLLNVIAEKVR